MAELEKLLCTDSKVESLKKINAIIDYKELDGKLTNCILEVPQRIKYTLENGRLTIKAGSVVIVPYGTEDLTAQYPVGATFLNDNFKVYDTQYEDGKFFVWAELQEDKEVPTNTTADTHERTFCLVVNINDYNLLVNNGSGASAPTGTATGNMYYNTTTNLVGRYNASTLEDTNVRTLPLMKIQANGSVYIGSINQVFNGFGYIGSVIWMDKGVKGLIPNGRNEDGTLKNIEFISDFALYTKTGGNVSYPNNFHIGYHNTTGTMYIGYWQSRYNFVVNTRSEAEEILNNYPSASFGVFVINENIVLFGSGGVWVEGDIEIITEVLAVTFDSDYNVTSYKQLKQPVNLATKDMVDGQIIRTDNIALLNTTSIGTFELDLSEILPNDGFDYDLYLTCTLDIPPNHKTTAIDLNSAKIKLRNIAQASQDATNNSYGASNIILPIGADRKITCSIASGSSTAITGGKVGLQGYRRLGTNL